MNIRIAQSDEELRACFPVLRELRPHIDEEEMFSRVRRQQTSGYRLAFIDEGDGVVAVAGFRIGENLAWDRFLYVDDLVTHSAYRSQGHGARLLSWLREHASSEGCRQLHLDSGMHRRDAHRFYAREGMATFGLHFAEQLVPEEPPTSPKTSPE